MAAVALVSADAVTVFVLSRIDDQQFSKLRKIE
jgi:hypothetical protein